MNVNLDKVRDDITKTDAEIAETEQMLTSLTAQMALLQGRKTDLETFLRLAEEYVDQPPPVVAEKVVAESAAEKPPAPPRSRLVVRPIERPFVAERAATEKFSVPQRAAMTLRRNPDLRQTQIAKRLGETFEPGDTLTAVEAQEKLGALLDNSTGITRVHFVSSFLAREADATNGILERLEVGKYRLRPNAKDLVEHSAPTSPPEVEPAEPASSTA